MLRLISKLINGWRLWYKRKHKYHIKAARRVIKRCEGFGHKNQIIGYLRKIDPQTFEELLLELFERANYMVLRNKKYSNDGGIDGNVFIPSFGWIPVQAKRYKGYIQQIHIKEFLHLLHKKKKHFGFFIHCGLTGKDTRRIICREMMVILLTGEDLADIILKKKSLGLIIRRELERQKRLIN